MIYSVWNHAARVYDYYETREKNNATSAPKPGHLKPSTLGLSPEQSAWPLPSNAKRIGQGKYPKGHIASKIVSSLGIDYTAPSNLFILGLVGFIAASIFKG